MIIIDSQVHIWAPETAEKPYAREDASAPHRPVPLGHQELLREMDGAGVERCILVPPTWEDDRNDTSLEAARLYPNRFRVMGRIKLTAPQFARVWRHPNSMPQYHVGHAARVQRIKTALQKFPTLALAGSAYHGVGISDCVRTGEEAAEKLIGQLRKP